MRPLATLLLCLLPACEPTPPQTRPTTAAAPPTAGPAQSSAPRPAAPPDPTCALRPRELSASTPASWGDVRPGVWLLDHNDAGQEVYFPASYNGPYRQARVAPDGSLRDEAPLAPFDGLGEASYPAMASLDDGVTAAVSPVYVARQNADVYIALRRKRRWSAPTAILPGSELDTDPVVAAGHGRFAVAWNRGAYPTAPGLTFALVEPDANGAARVLTTAVLDQDAKAEGKALLAVPDGWLLFYTPSSALSRQLRGLYVVVLDRDGHEQARRQLLREPVLWPIATLQGRRIGVAFTATSHENKERPRGVVGFLEVDAQGRPQGDWVVADRHADPVAGFRSYSLIAADDGGWWLADIASFHVSVMIARASEGRVIKLGSDGHMEKHAVLNAEEVGVSSVRIVGHGASVRGVYVEGRGDQRLRAFDLACELPRGDRAVEEPCAPRTRTYAAGLHKPLQGLWEHAIEVEGDLVVGVRPREGGTKRFGDEVHVARLRPNGEVAWDTSLGKGYSPSLAYRAGAIAVLIKVESGAPQELVLLDAKRGAMRARRRLTADTGAHCIIGTRGGWLLAQGAGYGAGTGAPELRVLAPDGTTLGQRPFKSFNACDLRAEGAGYLVAFTHPGPMSETNYLFVARLDANGAVVGAERRVEDVHFARAPRFHGDLLLYSGPLSRVLSAVRVRADLSATSPASVARTYGLLGYGFWGESIVWSTEEGIGKRGCVDTVAASPSIP